MKRNLRFFISSFVITLIFIMTIVGFVVVDSSKQSYGAVMEPMFTSAQVDDLHYDLSIFGEEYVLSLNEFNQFERFRKKYAVFTTPRSIRLASKLAFFAKERYDIYYEKYLESEYMESISE